MERNQSLASAVSDVIGAGLSLRLLCLTALAVLGSGCGKCPDATKPDKDCMCTDGTKLAADKCTVSSTDAGTSSDSQSTPPSVASDGFEKGESHSGWTLGDWKIDNTVGAHGGTLALHAPELLQDDSATATFDCNGKEHTELTFWYAQVAGGESVWLDFLVDGKPYHKVVGYSCNVCAGASPWVEAIIDVPPGKHSYSFVAHASTNSRAPYALDSFACNYAKPTAGRKGHVDFDLGFIPPEMTGEWVVDNLDGSYDNGDKLPRQAAAHSLALQAGDAPTMQYDCNNEPHTQVTFWYAQVAGGESASLDITLDGQPYRTVRGYSCNVCAGASPWVHAVIDVPEGAHTYGFTVQSAMATSPPFLVDSFACTDVTPSPAHNGHIDLDLGFIPDQITGEWQIDNFSGVYDNGDAEPLQAATHPPHLAAGDSSSMQFRCDSSDYSRMSFWYAQMAGGESVSLDVSLDGQPYQTVKGYSCNVCAGASPWKQMVIEAPGDHTLALTAHALTESSSPYTADSFACER